MESIPNREAVDVRPAEAIAIRAGLVVGVIAVILAVRLNPQLIKAAALSSTMIALTNILLVYWGLYAVTMAIGIEEKPFGPQVAKQCVRMSHNFFLVGVSFPAIGALITLLPFLFEPIVQSFSSLGVGKTFFMIFLMEDLILLCRGLLASRKIQSLERGRKRRDEFSLFVVRAVIVVPAFFLP